MSNTKQRGSAFVEMIFALLFLLFFAAVIQRFSLLAGHAHTLSVSLQNQVEKKMIDAGRPPCLLEEFGERVVRDGIHPGIFREDGIEKGLIFVTRPICTGGSI